MFWLKRYLDFGLGDDCAEPCHPRPDGRLKEVLCGAKPPQVAERTALLLMPTNRSDTVNRSRKPTIAK